jgi:hypothetical protein
VGRPSKKTVVEVCRSIEANRWMREGILQAGVHVVGSWRWLHPGGQENSIHFDVRTLDLTQPQLRLTYAWSNARTGEEGTADYPVGLVATRPAFGGLRWWFVCPLVINGVPCTRRVGKLYLPPDARYFGCRHCHQLTYTSCQESRQYDSLSRYLARELGKDFATVKRLMARIAKRKR